MCIQFTKLTRCQAAKLDPLHQIATRYDIANLAGSIRDEDHKIDQLAAHLVGLTDNYRQTLAETKELTERLGPVPTKPHQRDISPLETLKSNQNKSTVIPARSETFVPRSVSRNNASMTLSANQQPKSSIEKRTSVEPSAAAMQASRSLSLMKSSRN